MNLSHLSIIFSFSTNYILYCNFASTSTDDNYFDCGVEFSLKMSSGDLSMFDSSNVQVIEWNMLDKSKFLPLSLASVLSVRALVYPLTVIKTRIQVQHGNENYTGTFRTFGQIYKSEGWRGLYRGFFVNGCQVFSSIFYLTAYEKVRELLLSEFDLKNNSIRGLIAGGCASAASQLILVPFDVVSQHMMVFERQKNNPCSTHHFVANQNSAHFKHVFPNEQCARTIVNVPKSSVLESEKCRKVHTSSVIRSTDTLNLTEKLSKNPSLRLAPLICREIYKKDGLVKGFYRGYLASLFIFAPSSAMFWGFYHFYYEQLRALSSIDAPHLVVQGFAAPLSGATLAFLTNPLDLFRSNLQVHGQNYKDTIKRLYAENGWNVLHKGLSTRLITIPFSSFLLIVGYEFIKRLSVLPDLRHKVQW